MSFDCTLNNCLCRETFNYFETNYYTTIDAAYLQIPNSIHLLNCSLRLGEMANKIKLSLATKHQNIEVFKGRGRQKATQRKRIQRDSNIKEISIITVLST